MGEIHLKSLVISAEIIPMMNGKRKFSFPTQNAFVCICPTEKKYISTHISRSVRRGGRRVLPQARKYQVSPAPVIRASVSAALLLRIISQYQKETNFFPTHQATERWNNYFYP